MVFLPLIPFFGKERETATPAFAFHRFRIRFLSFLCFDQGQSTNRVKWSVHLRTEQLVVPTQSIVAQFVLMLRDASAASTLDFGDDTLPQPRPKSNLNFVSKLVDRVVAKQQLRHLLHNIQAGWIRGGYYILYNNLHESNQSGYRTYHITETAVQRVSTDILDVLDTQQFVILVLQNV